MLDNFRRYLARKIAPGSAQSRHAQMGSISARVDDSDGWAGNLTSRNQDYDQGTVYKLYTDALTAYRKNPIALRIIGITTDFVIGNSITISSPHKELHAFIQEFWNHPKNRMPLRLEPMCDELSRAGDIFPVLFRNSHDGMSYIRFITKDQINQIVSDPKDWETEMSYLQSQYSVETREWYSTHNPKANSSEAIMLHYAVNRPIGAILGESDLTTMIPWLQRYSRMLEDRVRLHWSVRAFLWMVTVPPEKVKEKREQYRTPPESGSVIIKDSSETWEPVTPLIRGADAEPDLRAVRGMIDAGSGYPAHWRGEAGDANLATANAMQDPTEKHLLRRQQYFCYALCDILYVAYQRAVEIGKQPMLDTSDYDRLFNVNVPDLSSGNNESLGRAARGLARGFQSIAEMLPGPSPRLARLMMQKVLKFAGMPQSDEIIDEIMEDAKAHQAEIWGSKKDQYAPEA